MSLPRLHYALNKAFHGQTLPTTDFFKSPLTTCRGDDVSAVNYVCYKDDALLGNCKVKLLISYDSF